MHIKSWYICYKSISTFTTDGFFFAISINSSTMPFKIQCMTCSFVERTKNRIEKANFKTWDRVLGWRNSKLVMREMLKTRIGEKKPLGIWGQSAWLQQQFRKLSKEGCFIDAFGAWQEASGPCSEMRVHPIETSGKWILRKLDIRGPP